MASVAAPSLAALAALLTASYAFFSRRIPKHDPLILPVPKHPQPDARGSRGGATPRCEWEKSVDLKSIPIATQQPEFGSRISEQEIRLVAYVDMQTMDAVLWEWADRPLPKNVLMIAVVRQSCTVGALGVWCQDRGIQMLSAARQQDVLDRIQSDISEREYRAQKDGRPLQFIVATTRQQEEARRILERTSTLLISDDVARITGRCAAP